MSWSPHLDRQPLDGDWTEEDLETAEDDDPELEALLDEFDDVPPEDEGRAESGSA
jgi:hypothetical protein